MFLEKVAKMNKYANLRIAIDGESVNIYIETGGEPIHVVYWTEDEWLEDAETVVPAIIKAMELFYTNPDEIFSRVEMVGVPDIKALLITHEEVAQFKKDWGQEHLEICCCLGFDPEDDEGSSEAIINTGNYFWHDESELWLNKHASGFNKKDHIIAEFLRYS